MNNFLLLFDIFLHLPPLNFFIFYHVSPVLIVYHLSSAGRSTEYTEVPLGALDIVAADSLTLSPPHGGFMMNLNWLKI